MATENTNSTQGIAYWLSALLSTLIFVLVIGTLMMVPGVEASTKMWMLSAAGGGAITSLCIGLWRFSTTDAPALSWPLGTLSIVMLLLEAASCALSVFQLARQAHP